MSKKKKKEASATEIINMLEFLHSGITWAKEGEAQKTSIGKIAVEFNPKTAKLEFRGPASFVGLSTPNENTAKRFVSSIRLKLLEAAGTNDLLEACKAPPESGIELDAFWGI